MKITIKKQTTETITVDLPIFSKKGDNDFFAIITPADFVNVYITGSFSLIKVNQDPFDTDLNDAITGTPITESEFFAAYDKARSATDLYPKLIAKTN
ncbi:MAG TPA: hypothetical protein PKA77_16625 [Chitinophagaceae bacterium]|nr:hypothetical protein [Chitinophagaceae bacterium]